LFYSVSRLEKRREMQLSSSPRPNSTDARSELTGIQGIKKVEKKEEEQEASREERISDPKKMPNVLEESLLLRGRGMTAMIAQGKTGPIGWKEIAPGRDMTLTVQTGDARGKEKEMIPDLAVTKISREEITDCLLIHSMNKSKFQDISIFQ
jgi:hypothetical protein